MCARSLEVTCTIPKKVKKWNSFWDRYLLELRQIEEFKRNPNIRKVHLPLLNQVFKRVT